MLTKKSYLKGHHDTQETPIQPRQKVEDYNECHHKAKNRIKPHAKDHIASFIRSCPGLFYFKN